MNAEVGYRQLRGRTTQSATGAAKRLLEWALSGLLASLGWVWLTWAASHVASAQAPNQPPAQAADRTANLAPNPAATAREGAPTPTAAAGADGLATAPVKAPGAAPADAPAGNVEAATLAQLRGEIAKLADDSFRARELARWRLARYPQATLQVLREAMETTDVNVGTEIVQLLGSLAMAGDPSVSIAAHEMLERMAAEGTAVTAVSYLAREALSAIGERQEVLAYERMLDLQAQIGPLELSVGGVVQNRIILGNSNILYINEAFQGAAADFVMIRFLRSVDTAFIEREVVDLELVRNIARLPGLKRVVLRGAGIGNEHVAALREVRSLEHLELAYVGVDDGAIETLLALPLTASLHLFGTQISAAGTERLQEELEELNLFSGRGGFLGVQTQENDLRVTGVVDGSGAQAAGIQQLDLLTHVNDMPIKTFAQLREQLANFAVGEQVSIQLERPLPGTGLQRGRSETMVVQVELRERPTQPLAR
jgi:hypothetical protein